MSEQEHNKATIQPPLLEGPRQTGSVETPSGQVVVHEITPDGMKQTRYEGERYKSAADFHREAGVAQPYEQEPIPDQSKPAK